MLTTTSPCNQLKFHNLPLQFESKAEQDYLNHPLFLLQRYYLVGWSKDRQHWRILKIDRSEPEELSLSEDPAVYSQAECKSVLQTVAEGNRSTGGLQLVTKAYGVVGA